MPSTVPSQKTTVQARKKKEFKITVNDEIVNVPVDEVVFTNYQNQIYSKHPTSKQDRRMKTVKALMREAYRKGLEDGKNKK